MNTTTDTSLRGRLLEVQAAKREVGEERAACLRVLDQARDKLARANIPHDLLSQSAEFRAAEQARDQAEEADGKWQDLLAAETGLLRQLGRQQRGGIGRDQNGPRSGDYPTQNMYERAARELDLQGGRLRIDGQARELFAGLSVTPSEGLTAPALQIEGVTRKGADTRFIFPWLRREQLDPGVMAISEFVQTGERSVSGEVERDPASTEPKAKLSIAVALETPSLRQFATTVDGCPVQLFESIPAFQAFLEAELAYQNNLGCDKHILSQVEESKPAEGEEGSDLIAKVRNAISAMRANGATPTLLVVSPEDAAALDLTKTELGYTFLTRAVGSASPLFNLQVVESPIATDPLLLDPLLLGVLYGSSATVLVDPFSSMDSNEVRIRVEYSALFHVRDVSGAYKIAKKMELAKARK